MNDRMSGNIRDSCGQDKRGMSGMGPDRMEGSRIYRTAQESIE